MTLVHLIDGQDPNERWCGAHYDEDSYNIYDTMCQECIRQVVSYGEIARERLSELTGLPSVISELARLDRARLARLDRELAEARAEIERLNMMLPLCGERPPYKWFSMCSLRFGHRGTHHFPPLQSLYDSETRCEKCGSDSAAWGLLLAEIERLRAEPGGWCSVCGGERGGSDDEKAMVAACEHCRGTGREPERGTFACPICGRATPHGHPEIVLTELARDALRAEVERMRPVYEAAIYCKRSLAMLRYPNGHPFTLLEKKVDAALAAKEPR